MRAAIIVVAWWAAGLINVARHVHGLRGGYSKAHRDHLTRLREQANRAGASDAELWCLTILAAILLGPLTLLLRHR